MDAPRSFAMLVQRVAIFFLALGLGSPEETLQHKLVDVLDRLPVREQVQDVVVRLPMVAAQHNDLEQPL